MNKKRGWMATLALTFGLGLAFGMSRPVVSAPPVMTVVELWHAFNVEEEIALNQIIADFEAVNPTIDVQPVHHDWNLLNQQYAVSATLGLPAVLIGAADWGPQYYEAGLVRELNSLADKALLDSLDPVALDAIRYEAVLVGLPDSFKGVILYRNTQIITQTVSDMDELIAAANAATQGDILGAALERGFFFAAGHLHGLGGALLDSFGCPAFNNSTGVRWLNLLDDFDDAGPAEYYTETDLNGFKAGKVGFIIDGTWNLAAVQANLGANVSIDAWPTPLNGYTQVEGLYLNPYASTAEQEAGWLFMKYLLSQNAQEGMMSAGRLPVVSSVVITDPLLQQAKNVLSNGVSFPILPQLGSYWGPMDTALTSVFDSSADPALALQQAYDAITADLQARGYPCGNQLHLPFVLQGLGMGE